MTRRQDQLFLYQIRTEHLTRTFCQASLLHVLVRWAIR
jgi:hypothetical protein